MKPDASQRRTHDVDSLTAVAFGVFAGKGFDGASMDDVAAAAGVTKAAIYHHVPSKEALLERGLLRALDALFAVLAEREATEGRAAGRVRWIVRRVAALTPGLLPELSVLFRVRGNSPVEREQSSGAASSTASSPGSSRRPSKTARFAPTSTPG